MLLNLALLATWLASVFARVEDLANCDPSHKDEHCPPDPAFAGKSSFDFTSAKWNDDFESYWSVDGDSTKDKQRVDFNKKGKGVALGMWKEKQAPTLSSHKHILFGKVSVEVQAAPGQGIVTAFVLKSDTGDEIDWEILGAYDKSAQSNYFYDGDALFNTYNDTFYLDKSVFSEFHTYTIEWTDRILSFFIDNKAVKTWRISDIPADKWPQTPMHVKLGTWAIEKGSDEGTIAWAGGLPKWDDAPFKAYFRKVEVEDYAGFCQEVESDVEYAYDERTQGWQNIKVDGCKKRVTTGMLTPEVPISGSQATGTDEGKPKATATDGSAASKGGHDASKTGENEAPPKKTGDDEDGAIAPEVMSRVPLAVVLASCVWLL